MSSVLTCHHSIIAEHVSGLFPPTPSVEGATYELDVYDLDFWRERLMEERLGLKEEKLGSGWVGFWPRGFGCVGNSPVKRHKDV